MAAAPNGIPGNPSVANRSDTSFFTGPFDTQTVLTSVIFVGADIPTADPLIVGQLWSDSGVLTISSGS